MTDRLAGIEGKISLLTWMVGGPLRRAGHLWRTRPVAASAHGTNVLGHATQDEQIRQNVDHVGGFEFALDAESYAGNWVTV
jgi:hypothetical protein